MIRIMCSLLICFIALIGCTPQSVKDLSPEHSTLRVLYPNEHLFHDRYGYAFRINFPEIDVEVIETDNHRSVEQMMALIQDVRPDVIASSLDVFRELVQRRELLSLQPYIQQDEFDLDNFVPQIIQFLREEGQDQLYGLTPTFSNLGTFLNEDLFVKYGVPLPEGAISWDDLFHFASQFAPIEGVYGYFERSVPDFDPSFLFNDIMRTYDLYYDGPDAVSVFTSSPQYSDILYMIREGYRSGAIYQPPRGDEARSWDEYEMNLFLHGQVAMVVDSNYFVSDLHRAKDYGLQQFHWRVIPEPVNPQAPERSYNYRFEEIFSVHAMANDKEAAWTLIQYIHGEDMAKLRKHDTSTVLFTRPKYNVDQDGKELMGFSHLMPHIAPEKNVVRTSNDTTYRDTVKTSLLQMIAGERTIKEVLHDIGAAIEKSSEGS